MTTPYIEACPHCGSDKDDRDRLCADCDVFACQGCGGTTEVGGDTHCPACQDELGEALRAAAFEDEEP